MKTKWISKSIQYDGTQLHSLWAYLNHKVLGPSILAFQGPCQVEFSHMVDGEDLLAQSPICGSHMLHFIVELFDRDLAYAVGLQRLFMRILKDELNSTVKALKTKPLTQQGDDIYWGQKKLSISIATSSPVSQMIHLAVNISNQGTPVSTCALEDFKINPEKFAKKILKLWSSEATDILKATQKVRPIN